MADEIDTTNERIEREMQLIETDIRAKAAACPCGHPGECHYCGETFSRVIVVCDPKTEESVCACGRCRDKRGIQ